MKLKFYICFFFAFFLALCCYGNPDVPYYYEIPSCSNGIENRDTVPFYDFDKPPQPFDKRSEESSHTYEDTSPSTGFQAISWKDLVLKDSDIPYLTILASPQKTNLKRKKRSVDEVKATLEDALDNSQQYGVEVLSPLSLQNRNSDVVKTIQFPSSFTPRFGRKRSGTDNFLIDDSSDRIYLSSDGKRRPGRLARIRAVTPRLSRSEAYNRVHLSAGSAFTPRLGRSNGENLVQLSAGSAFTPRLGRSEGRNRVNVNAGSAFTPRLGRSESNPNQIHLNAGSAFTPRLGRSEGHSTVQLNAGGAFTPRFGRSQGPQSITLHAGSAFTPRLGRSEQPNLISLNAGNAFTPRLG